MVLTPEQIEGFIMTVLQAPVLLGTVGVIISLLTSYIPGFREWYAALKPEQKSLGQLIIITVIVVLCGVLSWTGVLAIVPPGWPGFLILAFSWFMAAQANQATYTSTKNSQVASVVVIKNTQKVLELANAKAEVKEDKKEAVAEAKDNLKEVQAEAGLK